jgi:hypothetical protein
VIKILVFFSCLCVCGFLGGFLNTMIQVNNDISYPWHEIWMRSSNVRDVICHITTLLDNVTNNLEKNESLSCLALA